MFKGSIVALITPFTNEGIDEQKLRDLVRFQIESGTNGIVACGTTGESPTLTHEEHNRVVEICVDAAQNKVPVIAGTGSNSTAEAIASTKHAKDVGANGALIVTPYYNKPTQQGVYLHFKAIADAVDIPIILYNIEGRTARNIETETVVRLARDCKNIIGVKEASGSLEQAKDVKQACGDDFLLLSGDDAMTIPMLELGGVGTISVVANIVPKDIVAVFDAYRNGDIDQAKALQAKLIPLIKAMFVETNPIPVKKAAELLGLCSGHLRLPLCDLADESLQILKQAMKAYGFKMERIEQ